MTHTDILTELQRIKRYTQKLQREIVGTVCETAINRIVTNIADAILDCRELKK